MGSAGFNLSSLGRQAHLTYNKTLTMPTKPMINKSETWSRIR